MNDERDTAARYKIMHNDKINDASRFFMYMQQICNLIGLFGLSNQDNAVYHNNRADMKFIKII